MASVNEIEKHSGIMTNRLTQAKEHIHEHTHEVLTENQGTKYKMHTKQPRIGARLGINR